MELTEEQVRTELYRRTGKTVDSSDPAFLIVEINRILLESSADSVAGRMSTVADGFERVMQVAIDSQTRVVNEASAVIQNQVTALEAAAMKLSVPQYLEVVHPVNTEKKGALSADELFRERVQGNLILLGVFSLGLALGLLISGFIWVFFR